MKTIKQLQMALTAKGIEFEMVMVSTTYTWRGQAFNYAAACNEGRAWGNGEVEFRRTLDILSVKTLYGVFPVKSYRRTSQFGSRRLANKDLNAVITKITAARDLGKVT